MSPDQQLSALTSRHSQALQALKEEGIAVVLYAHGTVEDLDDMPAFLSRIRHGRPAGAELVEAMQSRYRAIGGSPLLAETQLHAKALSEALGGVPVEVAMRLWDPSMSDILKSLQERGFEKFLILSLAPFSTHVYEAAARQDAETLGIAPENLIFCPPFAMNEIYLESHVQNLLSAQAKTAEHVILSAHSLPQMIIDRGDPYVDQFEKHAKEIIRRCGFESASIAYQSVGADGGHWVGPSLEEEIQKYISAGKKVFCIAPVGFLSEHVETLYDLDIELDSWAKQREIQLFRAPTVSNNKLYITALTDVIALTLASK